MQGAVSREGRREGEYLCERDGGKQESWRYYCPRPTELWLVDSYLLPVHMRTSRVVWCYS